MKSNENQELNISFSIKKSQLCPGKTDFYNQLGERVKSYEIKNILLPSRETIKIITDSGEVDGISRQEVNLDTNWRSTPEYLQSTGKRNYQIKLSEVKTIKAKTWLSIDADIEDLNDLNFLRPFTKILKQKKEKNTRPRD